MTILLRFAVLVLSLGFLASPANADEKKPSADDPTTQKKPDEPTKPAQEKPDKPGADPKTDGKPKPEETPKPGDEKPNPAEAKPAASDKEAKTPTEEATPLPQLPGFKTVGEAISTKVERAVVSAAAPKGKAYLGVQVAEKDGSIEVVDVIEDSNGLRLGLAVGDLILKIDGSDVSSRVEFQNRLLTKLPGDEIVVDVSRGEEVVELKGTLGATSRPLVDTGSQSQSSSRSRGYLGVQVEESSDPPGAILKEVVANSPAEKAELKKDDIVIKVSDTVIKNNVDFLQVLSQSRPGQKLALTIIRDKAETEIEVTLGGTSQPQSAPTERSDPKRWKENTYRLAVILIEYPDAKHNEKITNEDWAASFFSQDEYSEKENATGQPVFGSMNDYYHELSCGSFHVKGKVFDWVEVTKKRGEYTKTTGRTPELFTEALDLILARDGKEALDDFDGVFFMYAGDRFRTNRGGLYWPHRSSVTHGRKRWSYFIVNEGGAKMSNISVPSHEFGHMLGLPDLYARPEAPGSEGVGQWCAMSNQSSSGRPQHFGAWCKEQLGWLTPTVIDPSIPQKLVLSPIKGTTTECFKVLIRKDGSEYLLLENRQRAGFDASLPGEGLIIWRVVDGRPLVEESHGIDGPAGPRAFTTVVPYPSKSNDSFTPHTIPSSRSKLGGGKDVHITNIKKLPDGRITFFIGYEYQ